jgi:CRISPR/Cas system-associated endoribonuclease Cas2
MKVFNCILISIILFSCSAEYELNEIDYSVLFHDNNSKVWLIDEINRGGKNYAPLVRKQRDVIIFYKPNSVQLTNLNEIGYSKGNKANFTINSTEKIIEVKFEKAIYDCNKITDSLNVIINKELVNGN